MLIGAMASAMTVLQEKEPAPVRRATPVWLVMSSALEVPCCPALGTGSAMSTRVPASVPMMT